MRTETQRGSVYYLPPNSSIPSGAVLCESPLNQPNQNILDILQFHVPETIVRPTRVRQPGDLIPSTTDTSDKLSEWLDFEAEGASVRFKYDPDMLEALIELLPSVLRDQGRVQVTNRTHAAVLVHYNNAHDRVAAGLGRPIELEIPTTAAWLDGTCHLVNVLLHESSIYKTEVDALKGSGYSYKQGRQVGRSIPDFLGARGDQAHVSGERKREQVHSADDMRLILTSALRRGYTIRPMVNGTGLSCSDRTMNTNSMSVNSQVSDRVEPPSDFASSTLFLCLSWVFLDLDRSDRYIVNYETLRWNSVWW